MRFSDTPFHNDVKTRLRQMVDTDRMPNALLLEGPAGSGKFMLARALVQYLHCRNRADGEPCGHCPSCLQHATFNHIDTLFSFPVIKTKSDRPALSADFISDFTGFMTASPFMDFEQWIVELNSQKQPRIYVEEGNELSRRLNFTAHGSKYKVVLMWLPERMNEDTANKLLKLIEEPSDDTKFILVSNNPQGILPTIYSRTQRIAVRRYDDSEVAAWLREKKGLSETDAAAVARISEGSLIAAENHTRSSDSRNNDLVFFIELMRLAYQRKIVDLRDWGNRLSVRGRDSLIAFFDYASRMLRENYIYILRIAPLNCMTEEEEAFSRNFSPFVNERNIEDLMKVFDDARNDIASNTNAKIVCFDVALKTILLLKR